MPAPKMFACAGTVTWAASVHDALAASLDGDAVIRAGVPASLPGAPVLWHAVRATRIGMQRRTMFTRGRLAHRRRSRL